MNRGCACALILTAALAGCRMPGEKPDFSKLTEEFVYSSLALTPVAATGAGYHERRGVSLDERLDDFSRGGIEEQRRFYRDFRERIGALDAGSLTAEERADREVIENQIALALLELNTIQSYRHNPTVYVELIGNALFAPYVLEYAPKERRFRQIVQRLYKTPALLDQAKENLRDSPDVWNRVARQENDGNIDLIDHALRASAPPELRDQFDKAAKQALDALRGFNEYLKTNLSGRPGEWRLGKEKYDQKFRYALAVDRTPEQLLADAEADLKTVQQQMKTLAAPKSVAEALNDIARMHAAPEAYLDEARNDLRAATAFVAGKRLLSLPGRANLQVIETPEFMRGVYSVGGFNPAPALEPGLGAFYWITPIPSSWPKDRVESKLREYNKYGLEELTIHEAMPGHYVQAEVANGIEPKPRRLLRNVYGNGPYVEGWAVYTQQLMSDQGYLNGSAELRLTYLKQMLRVISNAILDIRLHAMGMTEQQALDLMMNQAYQEKEEATGKWQRAQLSSAQLPTYFAGWRGWLRARDEYQGRKGGSFHLSDFHDAALREGAVPLPVLSRLLGAK